MDLLRDLPLYQSNAYWSFPPPLTSAPPRMFTSDEAKDFVDNVKRDCAENLNNDIMKIGNIEDVRVYGLLSTLDKYIAQTCEAIMDVQGRIEGFDLSLKYMPNEILKGLPKEVLQL